MSFSPASHTVTLADGRELSARFVVVGLGSEIRPPAGLPGGEHMLAYKSAAQFEAGAAALDQVLAGEGEAPTILVVGGGISGVEIAGELAHLARARPPSWRAPKVVMVHAGERLLPALTARAGTWALRALRAQGVELHLRTRLVEVRSNAATIRGPEGELDVPCALSFWAGGLRPPAVLEHLGLPRTDDGWLRVDPSLRCLADDPEIFAGGDIARVHEGERRWPTMQRAIEGIFAAQTIARSILTLAAIEPGDPEGVPSLRRHRLWADFPHGVSAGGRSLIVYGRLVFPVSVFNIWFRRFLMRQYMRRYRA